MQRSWIVKLPPLPTKSVEASLLTLSLRCIDVSGGSAIPKGRGSSLNKARPPPLVYLLSKWPILLHVKMYSAAYASKTTGTNSAMFGESTLIVSKRVDLSSRIETFTDSLQRGKSWKLLLLSDFQAKTCETDQNSRQKNIRSNQQVSLNLSAALAISYHRACMNL